MPVYITPDDTLYAAPTTVATLHDRLETRLDRMEKAQEEHHSERLQVRGYTQDIGPVTIGAATGLFYRHNNLNNPDWIVGAIPTASVGTNRVRARFTYIPPVTGPYSEVFAGQIVIRIR